jgi:hypothetical protein
MKGLILPPQKLTPMKIKDIEEKNQGRSWGVGINLILTPQRSN